MKELSIEQKARAYDEAKARMSFAYNSNRCTIGFMNEIFPELKEDKDERIRNEIIAFVEQAIHRGGGTIIPEEQEAKWIAWLEKQGESDETRAKMFLINKGYPINTNGIFPTYEEMYNIIREGLEKQCEQKTADKTKPKFRVGDWITHNTANFVFKIINVGYNGYEVVNGENYKKIISFDNEDNYRLWTIQDAKIGDVLALNWHECDDSWEKIIIFKKYHNKGVEGLINSPCVEGYGNTFKNGKLAFLEEVPYYSKTWTVNLHPATKEQRDLLFKKIADVGCYEWDTEKKELKKIEQKSVDEVEPKFQIGDWV